MISRRVLEREAKLKNTHPTEGFVVIIEKNTLLSPLYPSLLSKRPSREDRNVTGKMIADNELWITVFAPKGKKKKKKEWTLLRGEKVR